MFYFCFIVVYKMKWKIHNKFIVKKFSYNEN